MNKPLAIIAGYGYLGQQIGKEFKAIGWDIIGLSRNNSTETRECDISDLNNLTKIANLLPQPKAVIHCASSDRGGGIEAYKKIYSNGCKNLTQAFPNTQLLYTSSTSVYGQIDGSVVTEETEAVPAAQTGEVLLAAEHTILEANGIIARLAGIYGPSRSFLLKKILQGQAIIEENGQRYLNQIHRDDAARAIVHLIQQEHRGQVFNISDGTPLKQKDCYIALAKKFDKPIPPSGPRDLTKKRGWTNKQISNKKLLSTNWTPHYPSFLHAADDILHTLTL